MRIKVGIQTCSIQTAISHRRKFNCLNEGLGLFHSGNMGDHQPCGAILQQTVECGFFQSRWTPNTINVGQMVEGKKCLRLSWVKGPMLRIHPDAIVTKVGRKFGEER